jgi:hypothetical protein
MIATDHGVVPLVSSAASYQGAELRATMVQILSFGSLHVDITQLRLAHTRRIGDIKTNMAIAWLQHRVGR